MKLYRFIGEKEYNGLLNGQTIHNERKWSDYADTNSIGICFFANNRTDNINKIIDNALDDRGYAGIVKDYAIIEIEVNKARKAYGYYSGGRFSEYNLIEYSLANVKAMYKIPHKTITCKHWKTKELVTYIRRDTNTDAIKTYERKA